MMQVNHDTKYSRQIKAPAKLKSKVRQRSSIGLPLNEPQSPSREKKLIEEVGNTKMEEQQVPSMVFVYGGGPGTIDTAHTASVKNHIPVVVVKNSGRAADMIYAAEHESAEDYEKLLVKEFGDSAKKNDFSIKIRELVNDGQTYYYNLADENTELVQLIIQSLVENSELSANVKLTMLTRWTSANTVGADSAVRQLLMEKPIEVDNTEPLLDQELLVYAVFHNRGPLFRALWEHGYQVELWDVLLRYELQKPLKKLSGTYDNTDSIASPLVKLRRRVSQWAGISSPPAMPPPAVRTVSEIGGAMQRHFQGTTPQRLRRGSSEMTGLRVLQETSRQVDMDLRPSIHVGGLLGGDVDGLLGNDVDMVVSDSSGSNSDEDEKRDTLNVLGRGPGTPLSRKRSRSMQDFVSSKAKESVGYGLLWATQEEGENQVNEAETQEIQINWEQLYLAQGNQRKVPSLFRNLELKGRDTKVPFLRKNSGEERKLMDQLCNPEHKTYFFCRLYWAIITERHEVVHQIWQISEYPIVAALVVSYVNRRLAKVMYAHRDVFAEQADMYDQLATDVLSKIHTTSEAIEVLTANLKEDAANDPELKACLAHFEEDDVNRIDFAISADNKHFLATKYVQIYMERLDDRDLKKYSRSHVLSYMVYLFLFAFNIFVIEINDNAQTSWFEILRPLAVAVLYLYTGCYAFDEYEQLDGFKYDFRRYLMDAKNCQDSSIIILFVISQSIHFLPGGDVSFGLYCHNFFAGISFMVSVVRMLEMLSVQFPRLGVLYLTTKNILYDDVSVFILFLMLIMLAFFPLSYFFMPHKTVFELLSMVIIWPALGELQEAVDLSAGLNATTGTTMFVGSYFFFTTVVLMNLLIAMMSSTYESIRDTADLQYNTLKVKMIKEYDANPYPYPPPFNVPKVIEAFCRWAFKLEIPKMYRERESNWGKARVGLDHSDRSCSKTPHTIPLNSPSRKPSLPKSFRRSHSNPGDEANAPGGGGFTRTASAAHMMGKASIRLAEAVLGSDENSVDEPRTKYCVVQRNRNKEAFLLNNARKKVILEERGEEESDAMGEIKEKLDSLAERGSGGDDEGGERGAGEGSSGGSEVVDRVRVLEADKKQLLEKVDEMTSLVEKVTEKQQHQELQLASLVEKVTEKQQHQELQLAAILNGITRLAPPANTFSPPLSGSTPPPPPRQERDGLSTPESSPPQAPTRVVLQQGLANGHANGHYTPSYEEYVARFQPQQMQPPQAHVRTHEQYLQEQQQHASVWGTQQDSRYHELQNRYQLNQTPSPHSSPPPVPFSAPHAMPSSSPGRGTPSPPRGATPPARQQGSPTGRASPARSSSSLLERVAVSVVSYHKVLSGEAASPAHITRGKRTATSLDLGAESVDIYGTSSPTAGKLGSGAAVFYKIQVRLPASKGGHSWLLSKR
jgi:hypothetical protein